MPQYRIRSLASIYELEILAHIPQSYAHHSSTILLATRPSLWAGITPMSGLMLWHNYDILHSPIYIRVGKVSIALDND